MTLTFQEPVFYGLFLVISGGQCGSDQGGLSAAKDFGVQTGGVAPKGWKTCKGAQPQLARFDMLEDTVSGYVHRTKANVEAADGTVIIASNPSSTGSLATARFAYKAKKPWRVIEIPTDSLNSWHDEQGKKLAEWIIENRIGVLNVAGNRDKVRDMIHHYAAYRILYSALENLHTKEHLVLKEC